VTPIAGTYNKVAASGVDALVSFNGLPATAYKSNNFTINGIQFTAKKVQAAADLPINVVIGQDVDSTFNSIKGLIDKYNETIDTIKKKISEERLRDFPPLTDDQRSNLKDEAIKTWEDKAKSGLLRNDPLMISSLSNFRLQLTQPVAGIPSGDLKQLSDIGISTGIYQDKGKLVIDEAKLRQAISDKPEQVMNLFNSKDDTTSSNAHGIAVRMYDFADQAYKQISAKAGTSLSVSSQYTIGKSINDLNTRIDSFNKRLTVIENRYYKQFSAMESATNKFNAQSASLAKALGQ
jgi:flagellar hook-associated protein 2